MKLLRVNGWRGNRSSVTCKKLLGIKGDFLIADVLVLTREFS